MKKQWTIYPTKKQLEHIKKQAKALGISVSAYVQLLIEGDREIGEKK